MHPKAKSRLFHDLGELVRSGLTLPRAVEKLSRMARGPARKTLQGINAALARGGTLSDALKEQPEISEMDAALFTATERAGKLERGFALASEYYAALAEARSRMLRKAAYPLLVAHVAIFALGATQFMRGGFEAVGRTVVFGFATLWGLLILGWLAATFLRREAASSVMLDRSLGMIPVIGGMRRDLALSRFSAAYDMQLEAGVNVLGALEAAGRATASARYREAVRRALDNVRSGEPVSAALVATGAFPERLVTAFMVGEESGRLDQELRSVSEEYRVGGLRKIEVLSEWIPRIFYLIVVGFVAWTVVRGWMGYFQAIHDLSRG